MTIPLVIGVNPLQTTLLELGIVSGRVALLLRSAEIQPVFEDLFEELLFFLPLLLLSTELQGHSAMWPHSAQVTQNRAYSLCGQVYGQQCGTASLTLGIASIAVCELSAALTLSSRVIEFHVCMALSSRVILVPHYLGNCCMHTCMPMLHM